MKIAIAKLVFQMWWRFQDSPFEIFLKSVWEPLNRALKGITNG